LKGEVSDFSWRYGAGDLAAGFFEYARVAVHCDVGIQRRNRKREVEIMVVVKERVASEKPG
jgi:hypothetical protein